MLSSRDSFDYPHAHAREGLISSNFLRSLLRHHLRKPVLDRAGDVLGLLARKNAVSVSAISAGSSSRPVLLSIMGPRPLVLALRAHARSSSAPRRAGASPARARPSSAPPASFGPNDAQSSPSARLAAARPSLSKRAALAEPA